MEETKVETKEEETPVKEEKEEIKTQEKEPKKPFRKRLGERLLSDEPLIGKGLKRGLAIGLGVVATGAAIAAAYFTGSGGEVTEALPEAVDALPDTDVPFPVDAVTDMDIPVT